jgi:hypothetical protein
MSRTIAFTLVLSALAIAVTAAPRPARFTASLFKAVLEADDRANHTINLTPEGQHATLITGAADGDDQTSLHLSERMRLQPKLVFSVSNGAIERVALHYGDEAFAIPAARLHIRPRHGGADVADVTLPYFLGHEDKSADVEWPAGAHTVSALPEEMLVELLVDHQEVTTFHYTLAKGIPAAIYDSGEMYDLQPHNSTMLTKFMVKIVKKPTPKMSLWVSRKPIAPDFTLIIAVDGEILAQANIEHDPQSSDALGFDLNIDNEVGRLLQKQVDIVCHFYEKPRKEVAVAIIENLRHTLEELRRSDRPLATTTIETSSPHLRLRLEHHRDMGFFGLKVLQPGPMDNVQVSLYGSVGGERRLFLREGDDVVPFYPSEGDLQYGWDDALPVEPAAMTVDGVDQFDGKVEIEVAYNPGRKADHTVSGSLRRWIINNGGKVGALDLAFLDQKNHSYERRHVLTNAQPLQVGEVVAAIPYSTLVTSTAVERGKWGKMLSNASRKHGDHILQNRVHADAAKVMMLTLAVHMHLYDESMNFRPYFNTFTTSANKLPPFFTQDEIALFDFDPSIRNEFERMADLWKVEFETLESISEKLPRAFTKQSYYMVRSQVETKLLNISGELVLAPIVDLLTHDDTPNARVEYHDDAHTISIVAAEAIPAGTPITIDFGAKDKSALDFLIQYGFVPPKTVEATIIDVPDLGLSYITEDGASRTALVKRLQQHRGGDDDDDGAAAGDVAAAIDKRFAELSKIPQPNHPYSPLAEAAASMLATAREVLSKQKSV